MHLPATIRCVLLPADLPDAEEVAKRLRERLEVIVVEKTEDFPTNILPYQAVFLMIRKGSCLAPLAKQQGIKILAATDQTQLNHLVGKLLVQLEHPPA